MQYKKQPKIYRRYAYSPPGWGPRPIFNSAEIKKQEKTETISKVEEIPPPNEVEIAPNPPGGPDAVRKVKTRSIFDIIRGRIHIEEIILLGLIFLLLDDGIEDDFLLILLVYILLT